MSEQEFGGEREHRKRALETASYFDPLPSLRSKGSALRCRRHLPEARCSPFSNLSQVARVELVDPEHAVSGGQPGQMIAG